MTSLQSLLLLLAIAAVLAIRYLIVRLTLPPEAIPRGGLFNMGASKNLGTPAIGKIALS